MVVKSIESYEEFQTLVSIAASLASLHWLS